MESVNVELKKNGSKNRVLNISPCLLNGISFLSRKTDLSISPLADAIIGYMEVKDDLFIPQYDEIFKYVFKRYAEIFRKDGERSYDYKIKTGRVLWRKNK